MKSILLSLLVIGMIATTNAQNYTIDTKSTNVVWLGKKVTGEHTGNILVQEGVLETKGGAITGGKIVIDMSSMTNTDIESDEYKGKLIGHLKSDDFFGVEKFPTATFAIKSVKPVKEDGATHHFVGDITIKGVTQPMTIPANVKIEGNNITATSSFDIDRSKFGVKYGSGSFFDNLGDNMIYDDFNLKVSLVGTK